MLHYLYLVRLDDSFNFIHKTIQKDVSRETLKKPAISRLSSAIRIRIRSALALQATLKNRHRAVLRYRSHRFLESLDQWYPH